MYIDEIVIKVLGKTALEVPEVNQNVLRNILEEVLYEYDVQPKSTALVPFGDIHEKITLYLACGKIDGMSDATIKNYNQHLRRFAQYVNKNVADITTIDIRIFLANLQKNRKLKDSSLENEKSILKSFFSWLEGEDYITKSPARKIKPTKTEKNLREALRPEELEMLRDGCKKLRDRALVEFIFSTGCRVSEVVDLDRSVVNSPDGSLKVKGKGKKERIVFISPKARVHIMKYLKSRDDMCPALFVSERQPHGRLGKRAIEKVVKQIAALAGFNTKSVFPHLLRHTFATLNLKAGMPITVIQELMGHSNVSTTQIYAKIDNETVKQEYRKYANQ
jgi:integrase/recombinase XerD